MKTRPSTWLVMAGSALFSGCAFFDSPSTDSAASPPSAILPFAKVNDSAGSAEAWYTLGRHMQRSGRLEEAARAYRRALDADPSYLEAKNGLAAVVAGKGDIDHAIALLEELALSRPGQAHVLANLGYARSLRGQYREARIALEEALALEPQSMSIREKLDAVLVAIGEPPTITEPAESPRPVEPLAGGVVPASGIREEIVREREGVYVLKQHGTATVPQPRVEETRTLMARTEVVHTESVRTEQARTEQVRTEQVGIEPARTERVELVNGNGINGLARSLRTLMSSEWRVVRVLNHESYNVRATRIEYAHKHYAAARRLATELGVEARLRPVADAGDVHLRVVLGHDYRSIDAGKTRISALTFPQLTLTGGSMFSAGSFHTTSWSTE